MLLIVQGFWLTLPMQSHATTEVFTPTSPARLTFVEREAINEKLVDALRTPGKQLVVYGHSGSGKTTLLINKLEQLYDNHVTSRCIKALTFDQLILDALDQLAPYFASERTLQGKSAISPELQAEYLGLQIKLGGVLEKSNTSKETRILPPQLTAQTLGRLLGGANCCWVLEDFHKLEASEKQHLSQVMKVYMDMADTHKSLKIIAIGAVDSARQVVECDPEMRNRVAEIHVPLMTNQELTAILTRGEQCLNVKLPLAMKENVVHYSNGLASVCHHLALNICICAGVHLTERELREFSTNDFETGFARYFDEASDTLRAAFDRAFRVGRKRKFDNCKIILNALTNVPQEGATHAELLAQIQKVERKYPSGNLTQYLQQLQTGSRGSIVRYDFAGGRFTFSDPIYRAFCLAFFKKHPLNQNTAISSSDSIFTTEMMHELLKNFDSLFRLSKVRKNTSEQKDDPPGTPMSESESNAS